MTTLWACSFWDAPTDWDDSATGTLDGPCCANRESPQEGDSNVASGFVFRVPGDKTSVVGRMKPRLANAIACRVDARRDHCGARRETTAPLQYKYGYANLALAVVVVLVIWK